MQDSSVLLHKEQETSSCLGFQNLDYVSGQQLELDWVRSLIKSFEAASWQGPKASAKVLSAQALSSLLQDACKIWKPKPALLEIEPADDVSVVVVGDTHGQFHDVRRMFEVAGFPSQKLMYVFNGDYVDRGAWGMEILAVLSALSLALPSSFVMLRGNHESSTCTRAYGFRAELEGKYGRNDSRHVYRACQRLFASLPLAALIAEKTLVLHGGVFRKPRNPGKGKKRKACEAALELGTLDDLRKAPKGGQDPCGLGMSQVAADVLWSDPVAKEGLEFNLERGIGLVFGPDQTQAFMEANGLSLLIRSHEGPDARCRPLCGMPTMDNGFTVDHRVMAGTLMTVFSAPDYPQFQPVDDPKDRFNNLGAVAVLSHPDWSAPRMKQYEAVKPRPQAEPMYDLYLPNSDEDIEVIREEAHASIREASACTTDTMPEDGVCLPGPVRVHVAVEPSWRCREGLISVRLEVAEEGPDSCGEVQSAKRQRLGQGGEDGSAGVGCPPFVVGGPKVPGRPDRPAPDVAFKGTLLECASDGVSVLPLAPRCPKAMAGASAAAEASDSYRDPCDGSGGSGVRVTAGEDPVGTAPSLPLRSGRDGERSLVCLETLPDPTIRGGGGTEEETGIGKLGRQADAQPPPSHGRVDAGLALSKPLGMDVARSSGLHGCAAPGNVQDHSEQGQ